MLYPDLVPVYEAWMELHAARQPGFSGPAPISYWEIQAYANTVGLMDLAESTYLIRRLDAAYLDHVDSKQGDNDGRASSRNRREQGRKGR